MRYALTVLWEFAKIALIAFVLVIGLRLFVFQPFLVRGESMEPNFHNWDYLIVDEISYRFVEPQRGDVIVFKYPNNPSERYIKRIIGLPGEKIRVEEGTITIWHSSGELTLNESEYLGGIKTTGSVELTLGEDEYFVLGDNRSRSSDSRSWGSLQRDNIIGRALIRVFPVDAFSKISAPEYE